MAPYVCTYHDHAGAHARATFDTKDLAKLFAERHARAVAPNGTPVKWDDAGDAMVLTTQLGDYFVAPVDQASTRAQPPPDNRNLWP